MGIKVRQTLSADGKNKTSALKRETLRCKDGSIKRLQGIAYIKFH